MIRFELNIPMPKYRPICGYCEGRGVVPIWETKSVGKCEKCSGTGKESIQPLPADE